MLIRSSSLSSVLHIRRTDALIVLKLELIDKTVEIQHARRRSRIVEVLVGNRRRFVVM